MEEIWKDIKGYEGLYKVSNLGKVFSIRRNKLISTKTLSSGYPCMSLCANGDQKTVRVHRIVAMHFLREIEGKNYVNHIDGDKTNNKCSNLEWCTPKENRTHSSNMGLQGYANKAIYQISLEGDIISEFKSAKEAQDVTGICRVQICNALKGKQKTCKGYRWNYKN